MKKLTFLFLLFFVAAAYGQETEKLNVLFIISDDLTSTAISAYENQACQTPNLTAWLTAESATPGLIANQPSAGLPGRL